MVKNVGDLSLLVNVFAKGCAAEPGFDLICFQDFPYEDAEKRVEMAKRGEFILTEAEPAFDAADVFRCGKDIFVQISHVSKYAVLD